MAVVAQEVRVESQDKDDEKVHPQEHFAGKLLLEHKYEKTHWRRIRRRRTRMVNKTTPKINCTLIFNFICTTMIFYDLERLYYKMVVCLLEDEDSV